MRASPHRRIEIEVRRERFAPAFERRLRVQARTRAAGGAPATITETSTLPEGGRLAACRIAFFTF
jgi:hypothetical protein